MTTAAKSSDLLSRILGAPEPAVVLLGPAACGKTSAALEFYCHWVDDAGLPRCLLLVPNAPAANDLRRQLLDLAGGVLVAPKVMTFASLAERILAAHKHSAALLRAYEGRLLLRQIVTELAAAGKIPALAGVADTPGIVIALERAIAELKRAAIEPEALAAAIGPRNSPSIGTSRDLLEIYRRYQAALQASGVYDLEGRMWQARDCLKNAQLSEPRPSGSGPATSTHGNLVGPLAHARGSDNAAATSLGFADVAAIAVDGFTDFTPTQLEILSLLASQVEKLLITLPFDASGPERLWQWTGRTLQIIRKQFGDRCVEITLSADDAAEGASLLLREAWRGLFDADAKSSPLPANLNFIAASGMETEVAAVARRVKRLLLGGADAPSASFAGASPARNPMTTVDKLPAPLPRIAVLARSLEEYGPTIERVFQRHHIPVSPRGGPLTDVPIIRYLLSASRMAPDFAFADVLRTIKNSYFRPQALGGFGPSDVAVAEMIIREGNVLAAPQAYLDAAERLARRAVARAAAVDSDAEDSALELGPIRADAAAIRRAGLMLAKLFDVCANDDLLAVAQALDLRAAAESSGNPDLIARDLRAMATLEGVLAALQRGHGACETPGPLLQSDLELILSAESCPPARGENVVDVLDILDARAIRYDYVFLLGISEDQIPRRLGDTSLLTEADRQAWAGRGVQLDSRRDLLGREMLLFYLAVSRSSGGATISYLESDSAGRTGAPSYFLQSLLDPLGGLAQARRQGQLEHLPPGSFLPPLEQIASPGEAFSAGVTCLLDGTGPLPTHVAAWLASNSQRQLNRCAWGLWARHRRWREEVDTFDGRLSDPIVLEQLARRFAPDNPQAVFSASGLNTFGQCPWQFFATYVLNLSPLEEPQRMLQAVSAGEFCHNVMFRLMRALLQEYAAPLDLAKVGSDVAAATLDRAIEAQAADVAARKPMYPMLWQLQLGELRRHLHQYVARAVQSGARVLNVELSFGRELRDADLIDPASRTEPVPIVTPAGDIRLRGKIDRVDEMPTDSSGLLVVDYKTGSLPRTLDIVDGRNLQLPLYSAAAAALLQRPGGGGVFHRIGGSEGSKREQYFAKIKSSRGTIKEDEKHEENLEKAMAKVGSFVEAMRQGRFDLMPTHNCPSYCPFRQACHFSPARHEVKAAAQAQPCEEAAL